MDISPTTEKRRRATGDIPSKRRNPDVLHPAPATWRKCSRDLAQLLSNQSGSSPIRKSVQKKDKRAAGELGHGTEIQKTRVRQKREYHDEDTRGHCLPPFALPQESSRAQQALTARVLQFELSNSMPVPEYDLSTLVHPQNPPESQADFNRPLSWDRDFIPEFDVLQSDKSSGDFPHSRGRLDQKALISEMEALSNALTYGTTPMSPVRKWWIGDFGDGRPPEISSVFATSFTEDDQLLCRGKQMPRELQELLNVKEAPTVHDDVQQQREEQLAFQMKQVLLDAQKHQAQQAHLQQGDPETAPIPVKNNTHKMMVKYTISEDHSQGLKADRIDKLRRFHGREKDYRSTGKRIEHKSGKASTSKLSPGNLSQN
ncbi:hypothetical protein ATEIFO6365_0007022500 [Aspergillus terreus]|uniref:Uncharacterized protein n=1 Tax=Aspergillus terreus TaxID=33178 RepID=A0A5M3Z5R4_ASPTE|nr:hypothetical protein ATETN484_0009022500 [Aspergillus terreus]GFF17676.1 hypothetical protein ATEIFO6365_0007022500 [Aspergillus terreus]